MTQKVSKMNNKSSKTPLLKPGLACTFLTLLLFQIKAHRGLTSFIERHGVNGCWLKVDAPADIRLSKFVKILAIKAHYQDEEEFLKEWQKAGKLILDFVRKTKLI